jgi:N-acetylmuramoyl-L-alanine amidase
VSARVGISPGSRIGVSICARSEGALKESKKNKTKNRGTLRLIAGFLRFSENFTNLRKVIAICLNIELTVRNIGITCIFLAITLLNSASSILHREFKISKVVIDAGHGGHDPGTHGRKYKEKDIALSIALKVGKYIEQNVPDVQVVYTRKDDSYVPLDKRADIANKADADLFISIHVNSIPNNTTYGTETWVMGLHRSESNLEVAKRENSVILLDEDYKERYEGFDPNSPESYILFSLTQDAYYESSLKMAQKVEHQFKTRVGRNSRGVKQAGFVVLYKTAMPSVLVETGFITNPQEEEYLGSERGQDLLASGIYRAFKEYKLEVETVN